MTNQPTAVRFAHTARITRLLLDLAPEVRTIRLTPTTTAQGRATHVLLLDEHGQPIDAPYEAHAETRRILRTAHSLADWTRPHRYDLRTGRLLPLDSLFGPAELPAAPPSCTCLPIRLYDEQGRPAGYDHMAGCPDEQAGAE